MSLVSCLTSPRNMSAEGALMPYLANKIRVSAKDLKTLDE